MINIKNTQNNMNAKEIGTKLVELCSQGKNADALKTLYSPDIVSIEAAAAPGMDRETRGIDGVVGKNNWWMENHEVHSAKCDGPFPHDDRFAVHFNYDVTNKPSGKRFNMDEMALYTTKAGKIVREEFFYTT